MTPLLSVTTGMTCRRRRRTLCRAVWAGLLELAVLAAAGTPAALRCRRTSAAAPAAAPALALMSAPAAAAGAGAVAPPGSFSTPPLVSSPSTPLPLRCLPLLPLLALPPLLVALPHLLLLRAPVVGLHAAQGADEEALVWALALHGPRQPGRHTLPCSPRAGRHLISVCSSVRAVQEVVCAATTGKALVGRKLASRRLHWRRRRQAVAAGGGAITGVCVPAS